MRPSEIDFATSELPGQALHDLLAELRDASPIAQVRMFGRPAWLLTGYEEVEAAFKDEEVFPAGRNYEVTIEPVQGRTFESMDGPEHLRVRRLATSAFRLRALERLDGGGGLVALANDLVDAFASASAGDLVRDFTARFPFLVITRMLGIPRDAEDDFCRWALGILSFPSDPKGARKAAREFSAQLEPVIQARRREPREDVISELALAEEEGQRMSDEDIASHVRLLFSAGATTTFDGLGNLLYALLTHEAALDRFRDDRASRDDIVEELLRWETPVAILPRFVPKAARWRGVELPEGSFALFGITAANRDPSVFADPHRFDIERRPTRLLTFGLGSHSCPGLHLARKELRTGAEVLIERLDDLRLCDEPAARPFGNMVRGPRVLPVAFRSR